MAENDDESGPSELLMMSILSVEFPAPNKPFLVPLPSRYKSWITGTRVAHRTRLIQVPHRNIYVKRLMRC